MKYVLIIGAKSDIAREIAKIYAKNGYSLYLAGRNINEISDFASDLGIRYNVDVQLKEFDVIDFDNHRAFYDSLEPRPFGVIFCAGYMADQKECENDWSKALNTINVNYTGAVSILNIVANDFEKRKEGFIVGISSVAGDRGRMSNYIYGSSKAGLSAYLSGLRARLFKSNVHVLTVKPGFVRTKMTKHLKLPPFITSNPDEVARDVFKAQRKKKNVLYTKWIWFYIMLIIRLLPESVFRRLKI